MYSAWNFDRNPLVLPAGALRNYGQLKVQSTAPDDFGQPVETWTTVASVFAAIEALTEREVTQANAQIDQVSHRITFRWIATPVKPGMRFVYGPHTYLVQTVVNIEERNGVLRMLCLELNGTE